MSSGHNHLGPAKRTQGFSGKFSASIKLRCVAGVLLAALSYVAVGHAQPRGRSGRKAAQASAPSGEDLESARQLFHTGNERFAEGDFRAALEAYRGADALAQAPTTGFKVGRALAAMGRLVEARGKLLKVARLPRKARESAPFRAARKDAAELAEQLGARVPTLKVDVLGVAPDVPVTISIDGVVVPREAAHLPRSLDPGRHEVSVAAPGYTTATTAAVLRESQRGSISLSLSAATEEPAASSLAAQSPLVPIGFTAAALGAVAGAVTGALSLSFASAAKDQCDDAGRCPTSAAADIERSTTLAPISTTSFAIAGAGLVAGIIGIVIDVSGPAGDTPEEGDALEEVEVVIGPSFSGLRVAF